MAYFSNGTAGMVLDEQCSECVLGMAACPVFFVQQLYNYDQCKESEAKLRGAMSALVSDDGTCRMREELVKAGVSMPDGEHMAFAPDECGCLACRNEKRLRP